MKAQLRNIGRSLRGGYRRRLLLAGSLLLLALLTYCGLLFVNRQDAVMADIKAESRQLKLSLDDTIDVVRAHLFSMRRVVEFRQARLAEVAGAGGEKPGAAARAIELVAPGKAAASAEWAERDDLSAMESQLGSLHVDPAAKLDPARFARDLRAAKGFLPGAAAMHQWNKVFVWTYYYDAAERWFLVYPRLSRDELLGFTRGDDLTKAIQAYFDADGTRPVTLVGPGNNPRREMLWTPVYKDAAGKGMMVTLLAPIYQGDDYVGALGTDVTLKALNETLRAHAPPHARAVIVDAAGNLLADTQTALDKADGRVPLTDAFPDLGAGLASIAAGDPAWLRFPLEGTAWTLLVHVPQAELRAATLASILPHLGMTLLMFVALTALGVAQVRRYSWPALQLAEFVERAEQVPDAEPPAVSDAWAPVFEHVASAANERQALLARTRAQANELERKVDERTAELQAANASLAATVETLEQARHDLVRADRLGALGGMIAGVANELHGPLQAAEASASRLHGGLDDFKAAQARGLRKTELAEFVAQAEAVSGEVRGRLAAATELLARFKQLALDQSAGQARRFALREVAANVLAVMRPALALHGCAVDNRIADDIEMDADPGMLGQLLHHLLADALERAATVGEGGRIELAAGREAAAGEGGVESIVITLRDNGAAPAQRQTGQTLADALAQQTPGARVEAHFATGGSRVMLRLPAGHA